MEQWSPAWVEVTARWSQFRRSFTPGWYSRFESSHSKLHQWQFQHSSWETYEGQLGHGEGTLRKSPQPVGFFSAIPVASVACGADFTLCLASDGRLFTFGRITTFR
mgnify:CR=1 FL=1